MYYLWKNRASISFLVGRGLQKNFYNIDDIDWHMPCAGVKLAWKIEVSHSEFPGHEDLSLTSNFEKYWIDVFLIVVPILC